MLQGYLDDSFLSDFHATMSAGTGSSGPSMDEGHNNTVMKMAATATEEGGPRAEGDNAEPIAPDRYVLLPSMPDPAVRQHAFTERHLCCLYLLFCSALMEEAADYGYSAMFKELLEQAMADGYLDSSFFEFRP